MRGFTLIELLVVIGVISILAAIAVPLYSKYVAKAHRAAIVSDVRSARIVVESFILKYGEVPEDTSCPSEGFGPASCDLKAGTLIEVGALSVSTNSRVDVRRQDCGTKNGYYIHGTGANFPSWGYCFNSCDGKYSETDGSGCLHNHSLAKQML
ncbi:MAG TPA: pilin [Aquifex aeolicus]|nr:pilin [Aquifex aeolicus]